VVNVMMAKVVTVVIIAMTVVFKAVTMGVVARVATKAIVAVVARVVGGQLYTIYHLHHTISPT
jgi:hypothetical protein